MGLRVEKVVIGNDLVTRHNGNNPSGGRQTGGQEIRPAYGKKKNIIDWRKAKAHRHAAEKEYTRRYLSAETHILGR